ncbi:putative bifunctional exonuclease/endonuclease protein [Austwickia sp. TVS 96-490-7B]|nr:putative bifunctional exonuclease/endonuclease protein [Austwickia sp. TVS 96-490-7B]
MVVDLETTGGDPRRHRITEIGAVKVRGREIVEEFQSLVCPQTPIPPFIQELTGITDDMVAHAPEISAVLPEFVNFAADSVLVAHNAPFDIGFLRAEAARVETPWDPAEVVDTVRLARRLMARSEVVNCKLGTLAAFFGTGQTPDHRALHDARATADVLHALIDRVGDWEELRVADLKDVPDLRGRAQTSAGSGVQATVAP